MDKPNFKREAEVLRQIARVLQTYVGLEELEPVYRGDHHEVNPTSWRFALLGEEYTLSIFGE